MRRALAFLAVLGLAGCSTALSTMQPADTLPRGHVHVGVGTDIDIPVTQIGKALDALDTLKSKYDNDPAYVPNDDDKKTAVDAALGLALNAPGLTTDLMFRYGVLDRFDAGLRWTTTGIHLDAKGQFLRQPGGWDGSISVGYAHHSFEGLIFDVLDVVDINDFSRWDIEVPVIFGRRLGAWGRFWGGAKYDYGHVSIDAKLKNFDQTLTVNDGVHYIGGFAGFAAGYRWVQVFAELTVMDMIAKPTILGEKRDLGGIIIVPAVGVMARF